MSVWLLWKHDYKDEVVGIYDCIEKAQAAQKKFGVWSDTWLELRYVE